MDGDWKLLLLFVQMDQFCACEQQQQVNHRRFIDENIVLCLKAKKDQEVECLHLLCLFNALHAEATKCKIL